MGYAEKTETMEFQERDRGEREVTFQLIEHIGVISENKGWQRELNVVSWNSMQPKFDIRDWDEDHEHMRKGLTLTKGELRELRNILKDMDLSKTPVPETACRRKKKETATITAAEKQALSEGFTEQVPF